MPRQAHGRSLHQNGPVRAPKRKPLKGRGLNALQIAEKETPDTVKIRQHRLGETYSDSDEQTSRGEADERSTKRRKLNDVSDEDQESGSDVGGAHWHVGMNDDDEDSEIESDEAFDESDEERFAGFVFRGSKENHKISQDERKQKNRNPDNEDPADADMDDSEPEDDLGDDAIDLATAWDIDDGVDLDKDKKPATLESTSQEQDMRGSETSDEDSEHSDDSQDDESILSISEDEGGDHARLQSFVKSLSKDAQATGQMTTVSSSTTATATPKISAADLLQYVKDPQQRQSLKILQNSETKGPEAYRGGIPGRLAPPLAKRQQDRLDRSAAYEESKKEIGKWTDTVKRNRRAEHLSFPLVDPDAAAATVNNQLGPILNDRQQTALETKISEIMRDNGLTGTEKDQDDEEDRENEELQTKNVSLAEVQARRAELRHQRDLMFREEIRARRIKKIKSKAYRRIHRKEKARSALEDRNKLEAEGLVDSEEERERQDRRRAEARMGARHRDSKWAKAVKRSGKAAWDEDARDGVGDLARRDEELRRKVDGKVDQDSDASDSQSDSDDGGFDIEEAMKAKLGTLESTDDHGGRAGLRNMAFWKKAETKEKAANDAELANLKQQLENDHDGQSLKSDKIGDEVFTGRQNFGVRPRGSEIQPKSSVSKRSEFEEPFSEDDEGLPDPNSTTTTGSDRPDRKQTPSNVRDELRQHVKPTKDSEGLRKQRNENQLSLQQNTQEAAATRTAHLQTRTEVQVLDGDTSPSESEAEPDAETGPRTLADNVFFGPDDIIKDFEKEKKETVEEEDDQVIDKGLPGWGSWTGAGISKKQQRRGKARDLATIKGVAAAKRQDAKLQRVIINEKRVKKNGKYLAPELPHPFESQQQYERSLRLPLGPEWTTKSTFQDATKPRVMVKQGIIKPMAKPMA